MAASLAFGIVFATIITLLLIPSLYLILDDFQKARKRLWKRLFGNKEPHHSHPGAV